MLIEDGSLQICGNLCFQRTLGKTKILPESPTKKYCIYEMFLIYPVVVPLKKSALFHYFDKQSFTECPISIHLVFEFTTKSFPQIIFPSFFVNHFIDKSV